MSALTFRPLREDELDLFDRELTLPRSGVGARSLTFAEFLAFGDFRPAWTWVAQRDGRIVARAAFWAPEDFDQPFHLEWFDLAAEPDRVEIGAGLLRAMYQAVVPADYCVPPHPDGGRPDYHLFLPANWRTDPAASANAIDRMAAAEQAGLRQFVERLNLSRTLDCKLPPRLERLRFTPVTDDETVVEVFCRICADTLDADSRHDAERHGPRHAAELIVRGALDASRGRRDWWRLAYDAAGDVVGAVLPTRPGAATIWHVGVVPERRGRRYADDLVTEALHVLAGAGEPRVADTTDVGNLAMVAAFTRCGYRVDGHRMIFA